MHPLIQEYFDEAGNLYEQRLKSAGYYLKKNKYYKEFSHKQVYKVSHQQTKLEERQEYLCDLVYKNKNITITDMCAIERMQCIDLENEYKDLIEHMYPEDIKILYQLSYAETMLKAQNKRLLLTQCSENLEDYKKVILEREPQCKDITLLLHNACFDAHLSLRANTAENNDKDNQKNTLMKLMDLYDQPEEAYENIDQVIENAQIITSSSYVSPMDEIQYGLLKKVLTKGPETN